MTSNISDREWDRAWVLTSRDGLELHCEVVYAPHYLAARAQYGCIDGATYRYTHARRAPEWDRVTPTVENKIAAGWQFECSGCYGGIPRDDSNVIVRDGEHVFCKPACEAARMERERVRAKQRDADVARCRVAHPEAREAESLGNPSGTVRYLVEGDPHWHYFVPESTGMAAIELATGEAR